MHDDVIKWKHFPRHWPIVRGIYRWPVNSFHKGQWRGAVTFSLICAWINGWINNSEVGDLRRHRAPLWRHYNGKISYRILTSRYYNNFYDSARLTEWTKTCVKWLLLFTPFSLIVRRAGLLWSQQDFEWRWSVPLFKCLTVLEFSFILFDLCLLITFFNFIMNYVPIVTFWIFTYHTIWILSIMFCFIWSYWIIFYFLTCLGVSWRVVS